MLKHYSIGAFASKLGVTSPLLKYYEKQGLLKPEILHSGYRYYTVRAIPLILDMIKWKNIGFSAKDVVRLMQATRYEQLSELLMRNRPAIEQQIRYLQGVLEYTDSMGIPQEKYSAADNWYVGIYGDWFFLPTHTNAGLLDDPQTPSLLHEWQRWLPVVHPIAQADNRPGSAPDILWGLIVPADFARKQCLPLDEAVQYIPRQRMFCCLDRRPLPDQENDMPNDREMNAQMFSNLNRLLEKHHFQVTGPSYFSIQSKVREGEFRYSYQKVYVPIA